MDKNQKLPSKLASRFKLIAKYYETKQFKRGLKEVDYILKIHPNHGETLSMKGLILNSLNKKEEGAQLIKNGLKFNLKSHICWHVYGLMHKGNQNYEQAISCFLNALKVEPNSLHILRDLSDLQIQIRDLSGFQETRRKLLVLYPGNKSNWIAYLIACHLNKKFAEAKEVLKIYQKTVNSNEKENTYEKSELLLFSALISNEESNDKETLSYLDKVNHMCLDKIYVLKMKVRLLCKLEMFNEAENVYKELIDRNPDDFEVHLGLCRLYGVDLDNLSKSTKLSENYQKLKDTYTEFSKRYPKSLVCARLPFIFLNDSDFAIQLKTYAKNKILKSVPSLFTDLRPLYYSKSNSKLNNPKIQIIEQIFTQFELNLTHNNCFDIADDTQANPSCIIWVLFYLAQHYDYIGSYDKALVKINDAIDKAPTLVELYCLKAKVIKHIGFLDQAFEVSNEARQLDTADRYLNIKCVCYAFKANKIEEANKIVLLFLKKTDTLKSLNDMQCIWYETAYAKCLFKQKKYICSIEKYLEVVKHFNHFIEDQIDFHQYCLRKMTLSAYTEMIHFEDSIYSHPYFVNVAKGIVNCVLKLMKERNEEKENHSKILNLATKFVRQLLNFNLNDIKIYKLCCSVFIHKQKYFLALRCLKKAMCLDKNNPKLHLLIIEAILEIDKYLMNSSDSYIIKTIQTLKNDIIPQNLKEFNDKFLYSNKNSLICRIYAARGYLKLNPEKPNEAIKIIGHISDAKSLQECKKAFKFVNKIDESKKFSDEIFIKAHKMFPSVAFFSE